MASVCKPGVLRFLATASTGTIEFQNGFLAVCAPETRIIRGAFSDTILEGREREGLLAVANDLLDVLANAAGEAPLQALTLENTFKPAQFLGIIGTVIGFFLGGFVCIPVMFLLNGKHLFLIPVLILGGAALGHFVGKMLTRAK
jgi:VIT1/CCC1 family predicted Fe2+/Mn2+ transporter